MANAISFQMQSRSYRVLAKRYPGDAAPLAHGDDHAEGISLRLLLADLRSAHRQGNLTFTVVNDILVRVLVCMRPFLTAQKMRTRQWRPGNQNSRWLISSDLSGLPPGLSEEASILCRAG